MQVDVDPQILVFVALTSVGSVLGYKFYLKRLSRFPTVQHLPPNLLDGKHRLQGKVTFVGDGDNFRLYHTPGGRIYSLIKSIPDTRKELKGETLHIRIAGIDAPERPHFGKPGQPFGDEALEWLKNYILGRYVSVYLYAPDRYGRVVGQVYVRRWGIRRNVALEMIKAGYADIYEQAGAEYGTKAHEEKLRKALGWAKRLKRGMWSSKKVVLPSEHKRKHK